MYTAETELNQWLFKSLLQSSIKSIDKIPQITLTGLVVHKSTTKQFQHKTMHMYTHSKSVNELYRTLFQALFVEQLTKDKKLHIISKSVVFSKPMVKCANRTHQFIGKYNMTYFKC